ncbi:MAG: amidohydrolase [Oscillospiraceae bacterium]|nr:amidohydrolase [Oscillospiraceae bacterium]
MNQLEKELYEQVLADRDYVIGLRRFFHENPELAREEYDTQARIEQELDLLGIAHRRVAVTGVCAEIEGSLPCTGRCCTIALRADIDALPVTEESGAPYSSRIPGKMHACGHDAHTAALIGSARILSRNRDRFAGKVILTWQPGEEVGYGARIIVDEGDIDEADRSFGLHLSSSVPVGSVVLMPGPNNASVDWFRIRIHGLGSHVSAPERGVDAAYIASQIVVAAQSLITRCTSPMDNVLIGIGKIRAGTAYNVVAQEAELEGTIRVFSPEIRRDTKARLEKLARDTAELYGGSVEFEWNDNTSALINDPVATAEAQKTAVSLFGEEKVIRQRRPELTGDDFAEYILRVPGVYAYIGSADAEKPNTQLAHHHCRFDIDEDCLAVSTALTVCYTVEYLNSLVQAD